MTKSALASASAAVTAFAPGANTSTVKAIFSTDPEPAINTSYPAFKANCASTIPTFPAPKIPTVLIAMVNPPLIILVHVG